MSDYPLQPGQYTIENTHHVMQLVTAGDIIHGDRRSSSATQTWKLTYDHDGFAMFQGIPPNAADGDFIGIDTQAMQLVYSKEPSRFVLEKLEDMYFRVKDVFSDPYGRHLYWELQFNKDPVILAPNAGVGVTWLFA